MAIRSFETSSQTYATLADATGATALNFMSIEVAAAAEGLRVVEVFIAGQQTASAVAEMQLARESTVGSTAVALAAPNSDGPMNGFHLPTQAQDGSVTYVNATTTYPQRSNTTTSSRLQLGLNGFGGIVRWNAAPGQEWWIIGTTVSISGSILSNYAGTNAASSQLGAHVLYEPF